MIATDGGQGVAQTKQHGLVWPKDLTVLRMDRRGWKNSFACSHQHNATCSYFILLGKGTRAWIDELDTVVRCVFICIALHFSRHGV